MRNHYLDLYLIYPLQPPLYSHIHARMPLNIPTLKRKPNEEEDVLTKQRNEAMLHVARLAYERMRRIDEEDHERGMKEQQYNNSVKYQRMVEYELNNPGETATVRLERLIPATGMAVLTRGCVGQGVLEYEAIFKRSRGKRVKRRLLREAVANGEMEHVPVSSSSIVSRAKANCNENPSTALVKTEEARSEETRPFKDRLQSVHARGTTGDD